jgi:hypothetical protein
MSTQIGSVTGKFEIRLPERMESHYEDCELYATSFSGGIVRGRCLQLTISGGESYIQLDALEVDNLIELLTKWKEHNF